jgi:hypothetical protein
LRYEQEESVATCVRGAHASNIAKRGVALVLEIQRRASPGLFACSKSDLIVHGFVVPILAAKNAARMGHPLCCWSQGKLKTRCWGGICGVFSG